MPKWLLFGIAAVGDLVFAVITYRSGRVVLPIILAIGGVCLMIAALGTAKGWGGAKK
jgi:hypothetical protein